MKSFLSYLINNIWGVAGVVVSASGLLIAIIQLRKIANNTATINETYAKTIADLKNNETFTNISIVLQKIETIKAKIQENKIEELKHDLSIVAKLLVTLQSSISRELSDVNLENQKKMCNDLELRIITEHESIDKKLLKDEYMEFSNLELLLTKVQDELKYKRK